MTIPIICPGCDAAFDVPAELAGKTIRCTTCKAQVTVSDELAGVTDEPVKKAATTNAASKTVPAIPKAKSAVTRAKDDDEDDEDEPETKTSPAKKTKIAAAGAGAAKSVATKKRPIDDAEDDDDDDDRPKSKKKKKKQKEEEQPSKILLYGGGLLGLLALIGVSLTLILGSGKKKETAANSSSSTPATTTTPPNMTPPNTTAPAMPVVGTQPFSTDGFTCELPSNLKPKADAPVGGPGMKPHFFETAAKDGGCFVMVMQLPSEIPPDLVAKTLNEAAANADKGAAGGFGPGTQVRITSKTDIQQDGFPGKEFQFGGAMGNSNAGGVMRLVLAGRFMYIFGVAGDNYTAFKADGQRFMASVKIAPPQSMGAPVAINDPMKNPMGTTPMPIGDPMKPPMPEQAPGSEVAGKIAAKLNNAFNTGAFDTDKKELIVVGHRRVAPRQTQAGTIQRYSYPDFKPVGGLVHIPSTGTRAAIDSQKGLLYVTTMGAGIDPALNQFDRAAVIGDVAVYDLAQLRSGKFDEKTELKPTATIPVGFLKITIRDIVLSSDGKFLFVLTSTAGAKGVSQVIRVDTSDLKAAAKSLSLPNVAHDMVASPDGQKLYVTAAQYAANASSLMVVDANAMTLLPSFTLPKPAFSIAVAKDGRIVTTSLGATPAGGVGAGLGGPPMGGFRPVVAAAPGDINALDPEGKKIDAMGPGVMGVSNNGYVAVSPDGKYLVLSSQHPVTNQSPGLDVYGTSEKFLGDKPVGSVRRAGTDQFGGAFLITPDSDFIVFLNGTVLKLDDLGSGPAGNGPGGLGFPQPPMGMPPMGKFPNGFPNGKFPNGKFPNGFPGKFPGGMPPGGMPPKQ